jgi:hypothetical protein
MDVVASGATPRKPSAIILDMKYLRWQATVRGGMEILRSFPRKRESSLRWDKELGPRFRGDERKT